MAFDGCAPTATLDPVRERLVQEYHATGNASEAYRRAQSKGQEVEGRDTASGGFKDARRTQGSYKVGRTTGRRCRAPRNNDRQPDGGVGEGPRNSDGYRPGQRCSPPLLWARPGCTGSSSPTTQRPWSRPRHRRPLSMSSSPATNLKLNGSDLAAAHSDKRGTHSVGRGGTLGAAWCW